MPDRDRTVIIMAREFGDYPCDSVKNLFAIDLLSRTQVMGNQFDTPSNGYSSVHLHSLPLHYCDLEEEQITQQSFTDPFCEMLEATLCMIT